MRVTAATGPPAQQPDFNGLIIKKATRCASARRGATGPAAYRSYSARSPVEPTDLRASAWSNAQENRYSPAVANATQKSRFALIVMANVVDAVLRGYVPARVTAGRACR